MKFKRTVLVVVFLLLFKGAHCEENILNNYFGNNAAYDSCVFVDVDDNHWAAAEISYLSKYGIISGNEGLFYPDTQITRAQFTKILILAFGLYDADAKCAFDDVPINSWFYPYVASASSLSITAGISETKFGPDMPLQRQQMAVLLHEAAKKCGVSYENGAEPAFLDAKDIEEYAKNSVAILYQNNVISGDESNYFKPTDVATRAQASKMIYKIIEKLLKNP
ncbi:MAG: S-layer homology domain-containing protein [Firmicutes bacterium]|nr:S-layer homology domain-containing protein [Bacillota bacterium]